MGMGIVLFAAGLALLVIGAELLVRGASRVAIMLGISPMVIGLTIVSIGTSMPELAIGITASWQGSGGLVVGNVTGANLFVMLVVFGISALIRPLPLDLQILKLELPTIVLAAMMMMLLAWDGVLSRVDGLLMFLAGCLYTGALFAITSRSSRESQQEYLDEYGPELIPLAQRRWRGKVWYAAMLLVGIILTVLGADVLVDGAIRIATYFDVSTTVIGLTVVAFGTSAPELVTTIVATMKDDRDVAIGNLLGSSIYNILAILSLTCMFSPEGLPVEPHLLWFDLPLMAGVAIGAIPIFWTGHRISRLEGALGIAIYLAYLTWLIFFRN